MSCADYSYEGGHRVPLIARWPGKIAANVVIDELTSSLDWYPTILNLAGVQLPSDRTIDGIDMHDVLFGQGPSQRKEFLYFEWRTAVLMAVRIGATVRISGETFNVHYSECLFVVRSMEATRADARFALCSTFSRRQLLRFRLPHTSSKWYRKFS